MSSTTETGSQCHRKMGRTIGEKTLPNGGLAFTVTRSRSTYLRHFLASLAGLVLWVVVASLAHAASHSNYAWILLAPGMATFAWLLYTLCFRCVGVVVGASHVTVRTYIGLTRLPRIDIRNVVVRTLEPVGRAKLGPDDHKHYLALDTANGRTTICFFDMKYDVLDEARGRIENAVFGQAHIDVEKANAGETEQNQTPTSPNPDFVTSPIRDGV